jgi:hypothetical protein
MLIIDVPLQLLRRGPAESAILAIGESTLEGTTVRLGVLVEVADALEELPTLYTRMDLVRLFGHYIIVEGGDGGQGRRRGMVGR